MSIAINLCCLGILRLISPHFCNIAKTTQAHYTSIMMLQLDEVKSKIKLTSHKIDALWLDIKKVPFDDLQKRSVAVCRNLVCKGFKFQTNSSMKHPIQFCLTMPIYHSLKRLSPVVFFHYHHG